MKKLFSKSLIVGIVIGAVLIGVAAAIYVNTYVNRPNSVEIDFKKGHKTEISFTVDDIEEKLVTPDEQRTIDVDITNVSKTDSAYVFIEVANTSGAWSVTPPDGWVVVSDNLFAYAGENMTPLDSGSTTTFSAVITVVATGMAYQSLENEDFKVTITAKAINSIVSRTGIEESYEDFVNGGNAEMIAVVEEA